MKYIRSFETLASFQAVQTTLDRPNVSLIKATMVLNYLPYVAPVVPQHDYVEIGGIKWATMNVGANSITDTGLYFQWGDTQGYTVAQAGVDKSFNFDNYKFTVDGSTYTKYNSTDNKTTLDLEDDAVNAAWGSNWRMPTLAEYQTLRAAVNISWQSDYQGSGVEGNLLIDKNDSSKILFFPIGGIILNSSVQTVGGYWNSTLAPSFNSYNNTTEYDYGYEVAMMGGQINWQASMGRAYGLLIRGVYDDSNS